MNVIDSFGFIIATIKEEEKNDDKFERIKWPYSNSMVI